MSIVAKVVVGCALLGVAYAASSHTGPSRGDQLVATSLVGLEAPSVENLHTFNEVSSSENDAVGGVVTFVLDTRDCPIYFDVVNELRELVESSGVRYRGILAGQNMADVRRTLIAFPIDALVFADTNERWSFLDGSRKHRRLELIYASDSDSSIRVVVPNGNDAATEIASVLLGRDVSDLVLNQNR